MSSNQAVRNLEDRIGALRVERGETVRLDEIGATVAAILPADGDAGEGIAALGRDLRETIATVGRAMEDLAALCPRDMAVRELPGARDELDAVIANTAEAAGRFMDVAERMGSLADTLADGQGELLAGLTTEIFEASSFQDITGQRVNKVRGVLREVERRLAALADLIGDEHVGEAEVEIFDERGEVIDEEALKHGPQLEGQGNSQADIDALLASFD